MHPAVRRLVTICRCNNIKLGTIERAILDGATTIAEVGKRTTATTGQCGGSCTPKVVDLIESLVTPEPTAPDQESEDEDAWWIRK